VGPTHPERALALVREALETLAPTRNARRRAPAAWRSRGDLEHGLEEAYHAAHSAFDEHKIVWPLSRWRLRADWRWERYVRRNPPGV